jgi:hypothetical protein
MSDFYISKNSSLIFFNISTQLYIVFSHDKMLFAEAREAKLYAIIIHKLCTNKIMPPWCIRTYLHI